MTNILYKADLTKEDKSKMFNLFRESMEKNFNMDIDEICFHFNNQLGQDKLEVIIGEKGYIIGHEVDKHTYTISDLYFTGLSKELKTMLDTLQCVWEDYENVICNCNLNSIPIAEKYGFYPQYVRMVRKCAQKGSK